MKKVFITQYNFDPTKTPVEKTGKTVLTVPDMSLTVRDILKKHAAGISPAISQLPIWTENPNFDDFDPTYGDFDLVDARELLTGVNERLNAIEEQKAKHKRFESEQLQKRVVELEALIATFDGKEGVKQKDLTAKENLEIKE